MVSGTMPAPLISPPPPHATPAQGSSRPSTSHRSSTNVSQARPHATPKQSSVGGNGSGVLRSAKVRGSSDKENGGEKSAPARSTRRPSTASALAPREKLPSKDGTAQRNAKQVEGLKDYVRVLSATTTTTTTRGKTRGGARDYVSAIHTDVLSSVAHFTFMGVSCIVLICGSNWANASAEALLEASMQPSTGPRERRSPSSKCACLICPKRNSM